MKSHKVLLVATVIETDNGAEVHLMVHDDHLSGCKSCMAVSALRVSNAFLHAIDQVETDVEVDVETEGQHQQRH